MLWCEGSMCHGTKGEKWVRERKHPFPKPSVCAQGEMVPDLFVFRFLSAEWVQSQASDLPLFRMHFEEQLERTLSSVLPQRIVII